MIAEVAIVFGLVVLNGFFAMAELAIVSASRPRLKAMAEAGSRGAARALALAENAGSFLATVQVGITLVGILAGAYGGASLSAPLAAALTQAGVPPGWAQPLAFVIVVGLITFASLIVGELVPKRLALQRAEAIAAAVSGTMTVVARVGSPIVWVLDRTGDLVLRLIGAHAMTKSAVTEEEVHALLSEGTEAGVFEPAEAGMVKGIFRLADRSVRSIMTPRHDVDWIDLADDLETTRRQLLESGHTCLPVMRGGMDEIVGVVETRSLVEQALAGKPVEIEPVVVAALVVPETMPVLELVERFRSARPHFAVVVDEFGGFEGIATPTDILAAIAGELAWEATEGPLASQREDGSWLFEGMSPIAEVERILDVPDLSDGEAYQTLAGLVLWRLGRLPNVAEFVDWKGWRFEVVDMDGRRIDKIMVRRQAE